MHPACSEMPTNISVLVGANVYRWKLQILDSNVILFFLITEVYGWNKFCRPCFDLYIIFCSNVHMSVRLLSPRSLRSVSQYCILCETSRPHTCLPCEFSVSSPLYLFCALERFDAANAFLLLSGRLTFFSHRHSIPYTSNYHFFK